MKRTNILIRALLIAALPASALAAPDCEGLAKLALPNTSITRAESVAAGALALSNGTKMPDLPAFCRVAGVSKPSDDSDIEFEVWMPASGWNGKFLGVGNGGFAGAIEYRQMGPALAHGYATASTDTGHHGSNDAQWASGHPEKVIDYGYRGIHLTAANAKVILRTYYGEAPARSYFSSCSNGGRQALMEAQRYPEDYDGIVAGAPANYWTHLLSNAAWDLQALQANNDSYIPAKKLPAIGAAVLGACDALDGLKDGIIEDPTRCHFDPSTLLCPGAETDACLTAPQVTALKSLYAGGRMSDGKQIFPGYSPGGEADTGSWSVWLTGPAPGRSLMFFFGTQFFKYMLYNDPAWDYRTFNADRDTKAADEKFASILNATDPDLSRFAARGGKLILYHGWTDPGIAPRNTIDYFNSVAAKMGEGKERSFVRLFMAPGMQHCFGGAGPNSFGQFGPGNGDPTGDIDAALERWVEKGIAPERIVAAKRASDIDATSQVVRTRPLCAWPLVAHYKGAGSIDDAANFTCAAESK